MIFEAINGINLPEEKAERVGFLRSWPTVGVPSPPISKDDLVARMAEDGFPHAFTVDEVTRDSSAILIKFLDGMDTDDLGEWTVVVCDHYPENQTSRRFVRCMIVFSRDQRTHIKLAFFNGYSIDQSEPEE